MELRISQIRKVSDNDRVKAVFSFVIDGKLVVHDIKLVNVSGKIFLAMPCRKVKDEWRDIVHPIDKSLRAEMEALAIEAYKKTIITMEE